MNASKFRQALIAEGEKTWIQTSGPIAFLFLVGTLLLLALLELASKDGPNDRIKKQESSVFPQGPK